MPLPYTGKYGELNFEADLIAMLQSVGWNDGLLKNVDEKDLIENWRNILNTNNKAKLNGVELSDNEMMQIMEHVRLKCNTPVKANSFINGKDICIIRDGDSKDTEHAGKEVYLEIFDPVEIAGGKSKYQIAEQIKYNTSANFNDRRGDVLLLINGIPVIHIELKASGVSVTEASNQIKKYAKEGIWTGLFSLIQVFFAMTPEDVVYFANPGAYTNYNDAFFFHWGDTSNNPIKDWKTLCKGENAILSIPEAHQLVGYYTIADKNKDILKVSRSYQCHAIRAILKRVANQNWGNNTPLGGYVWCTTGGGKTMTSFKAGQTVFGKCLATYSIASGIRDGNVLGFDPKAVKTYEDSDLREHIVLDLANAKNLQEVKDDATKFKIYKKIMKLDMAAKKDEHGKIIEKGVENYLPVKQYNNDDHRGKVVEDILKNWDILSKGEKGTQFHAILSTTSIAEVCIYYEIFNSTTNLNVTTLFDPTIDNGGDSSLDKEDAMNIIYAEIDRIFKAAKVQDFMCLPRDDASCQKFKKEFSQMKIRLSSAKLQGFAWNNSYGAKLNFDEKTYKILEMRYQDLTHRGGFGGGVPGTGYNLPTILLEMAMDKIDSDYLESHFKIVVPIISGSDEEEKEKAIETFKKELASLPGIQQVYALKIIDDIKNGVLVVDHSKTLLEYINEYMEKDTSDKIQEMANAFGLNFDEFKNIVTTSKNEMELNEHDRFNTLLKTVDTNKANKYFLDKEGVDLQGLKLKSRINRELKEFILGKKVD